MNKSYALPSALAFVAHALLFVGAGKPPSGIITPSKPDIVRELPKDELEQQFIELVKEVAVSDPQPGSGGGESTESELRNPPGMPDIPANNTENRMAQDYKPVTIGINKTIPGTLPGFGPGDGNGTGVYTAKMLDATPSTRYQKSPVYPAALKRDSITGTVWVEFLVDESGHVHDLHVTKSSNEGFNAAALDAVAQWRFVPGTHKGLPVKFRMSLPLIFSISN